MARHTSALISLKEEILQGSLLPIQKELYYAGEGVDMEVVAPFLYERRVFTHSPHVREVMSVVHSQEQDQAIYSADKQYNKLMNVYLTWRPPPIVVKEKYRGLVEVAWTPNLFHNIIKSLSWVLGRSVEKKFVQTFETYALDLQIKTSPHPELYLHMIGNRPELVEWSNHLETTEDLLLNCPFSFSETEKYAVPLHLLMGEYNALFEVNYVCSLSQLLRMRVREDDTAEWTELASPYISLNFLEKAPGKKLKRIPIPAMYGEYSMLCEDQLAAEKLAHNMGKYKLHITELVPGIQKETGKGTSQVPLVCDLPLRQIHFGFLNYHASLLNNHSNYTTHPYEASKGIGPLEGAGLLHGIVARVPLTDSSHWSCHSYYRYSRHAVRLTGYYMHSASYYPDSYWPDESMNVSQGKHALLVNVREHPHRTSPEKVVGDQKYVKRDEKGTIAELIKKSGEYLQEHLQRPPYTLLGVYSVYRQLKYVNNTVRADAEADLEELDDQSFST